MNEPTPSPPSSDSAASDGSLPIPGFLFVICQAGAEAAVKDEILSSHPELKFSFSRPGFVTFKLDETREYPPRWPLRSTLARTWGWSLGRVQGETAEPLAAEIAQLPWFGKVDRLHVWERDRWIPGSKGFEPGLSPLAEAAAGLLAQHLPESRRGIVNQVAQPDQRVLDVILVEPGEWWYGWHLAAQVPQRWPGGVPKIDTEVEVISRAGFKLREALLWSGLRIHPGDRCAEIGSSPGGACEVLLELGAEVLAIDPAELEPELLTHERLTHIRRRGNEVRKRDFKGVKWLLADLNTDPDFTLDTVAEIASHAAVNLKGLILTLKLSDWELVKSIPAYRKRVRDLGFQVVKSRQLAFNRREFCLVGIRNRITQRKSTRTRAATPAPASEPPATPEESTE